MAEKISFEQALDKLEGYAQALSSPEDVYKRQVKERRHLVAHRGARNVDPLQITDALAPDGLPRLDILAHDSSQNPPFSRVESHCYHLACCISTQYIRVLNIMYHGKNKKSIGFIIYLQLFSSVPGF